MSYTKKPLRPLARKQQQNKNLRQQPLAGFNSVNIKSEPTKLEFAFFYLKEWSWRESNPRPNKQSKCFLHVYLTINFRMQTGSKQPILHLILFISQQSQGFLVTISKLLAPLSQTGIENLHPRDVLFQHLVSELSITYYDSVTQQERIYFRQLNGCN